MKDGAAGITQVSTRQMSEIAVVFFVTKELGGEQMW